MWARWCTTCAHEDAVKVGPQSKAEVEVQQQRKEVEVQQQRKAVEVQQPQKEDVAGQGFQGFDWDDGIDWDRYHESMNALIDAQESNADSADAGASPESEATFFVHSQMAVPGVWLHMGSGTTGPQVRPFLGVFLKKP
eukprot:SAG31_NODE_19_length_35031_cov_42.510707_6_plen_138_part_00